MQNNIEIWKDIANYEGLYQVSNFGKVRSLDRLVKVHYGERMAKGKPIMEIVDGLGYSRLSLSKNNIIKTHKIHRLVANTFIDGEGHVNHKDGNKQNNRVENLEYCTNKQNHAHACKNELRPKKYKRLIKCNETNEIFQSQSELAKHLKISPIMISTHLRGNTKHLKNQTFQYL